MAQEFQKFDMETFWADSEKLNQLQVQIKRTLLTFAGPLRNYACENLPSRALLRARGTVFEKHVFSAGFEQTQLALHCEWRPDEGERWLVTYHDAPNVLREILMQQWIETGGKPRYYDPQMGNTPRIHWLLTQFMDVLFANSDEARVLNHQIHASAK
jgi:hypothetical protein